MHMLPDLEQIKTILQGISAVAALIGLRRKKLDTENREPSNQEIDETIAAVPPPSPQEVLSLRAVIDADLARAINEVIERAKKRYEDAVRDPANTRQARDAETKIAESTICGELERIKRHNAGTLPDEFENDWEQFNCT